MYVRTIRGRARAWIVFPVKFHWCAYNGHIRIWPGLTAPVCNATTAWRAVCACDPVSPPANISFSFRPIKQMTNSIFFRLRGPPIRLHGALYVPYTYTHIHLSYTHTHTHTLHTHTVTHTAWKSLTALCGVDLIFNRATNLTFRIFDLWLGRVKLKQRAPELPKGYMTNSLTAIEQRDKLKRIDLTICRRF